MSEFKTKIAKVVSLIPYGQVASYGQVAAMAGYPRAAIAVAGVLHGKDETLPWWRVINSKGLISINCVCHTPIEQKRLLESEGVVVNEKLQIDLTKYQMVPSHALLKSLKLSDSYVEHLVKKYLI